MVTFGNVAHPRFLDRPILKAEGMGWDDLGKRTVRGVVLHRMEGSLWGTDGYFRSPSVNALTDYGVGVLATDGAANDGVIMRWNDPQGRRSGWASGPVNQPYGDGKAFLDKYGPPSGIGTHVVNRDQVSIEISGGYSTQLSAKAAAAIAGLIAYWADQARIPWNVFPITPADGFSFVRWHQEFCKGTGKICPGPVVMDQTDELVAAARKIMQAAQETAAPAPTAYPAPTPVAAGDQQIGGRLFAAAARTAVLRQATVPRQWADPQAQATGAALPAGANVSVTHVCVGADARPWFVLADGSRVPVAAVFAA